MRYKKHGCLLQDVTITTPSLQMTLVSISSEGAASATDGAWTPSWREHNEREVPSDGTQYFIITLFRKVVGNTKQ